MTTSAPTPWQNYRNQAVRDLAWVLWSPDFFTHWPAPVDNAGEYLKQLSAEAIHQQLTCLDRSPGGFPEPPARLGRYFEQLLHALIARGLTPWEPVAQGVVIEAEGRTLGELDFVVRDHDRLCHLEAAVKFYLLKKQGDPQRLEHWLGPNARDRLDLKYHHLLQKQLTRLDQLASQSPVELQALLAGWGAGDVPDGSDSESAARQVGRYCLMKGMLFCHYLEPVTLPAGVNAGILTGHWLYLEEARELETGHWQPLAKHQWLAGPADMADSAGLQVDQAHPLMYEVDGSGGRVIVVPDYWPDTRVPSRRI